MHFGGRQIKGGRFACHALDLSLLSLKEEGLLDPHYSGPTAIEGQTVGTGIGTGRGGTRLGLLSDCIMLHGRLHEPEKSVEIRHCIIPAREVASRVSIEVVWRWKR